MAEIPVTPRASIVIPAKDAGPGFRETLGALLDQSFPGAFEVIVIDSGSQDGTVELCRRFPVRLIQIAPASFGHGITRNQALTEAQGEFVGLTVQDAVPADSGWLQAMLQPMIDDPQVAGVHGRQVPRPGASYLARQRNRLWYGTEESRTVQELEGAEAWPSLSFEARRAVTRFDNVTSCLRRSVWEEIPFPPYSYAEDVGWARQALEAGYKLVYEPAAQVYHSHDRDLAYELQRAYMDARNTAAILDAPPYALSATEARHLLGWLGDQARSYLAALNDRQVPPANSWQALSQADAHWTILGTSQNQGQRLEAPTLERALRDEAWHRERFDTSVVRHLLGPDSPYPAQERERLLAEIGWAQAEPAEEKALCQAVFDSEATHYLLGPDSSRPAADRAWLAGKLQLWAEDENEAKAHYQAHFDAECVAYLLGSSSPKSAEDQAWLAGELDWLEQEGAQLGPHTGRRLSQRLAQSQPREEDVSLAFKFLWDMISRDYAREAVNVRFLQMGIDAAHLFDRLWAVGAPDLLKEAIARQIRAGIEAALTEDRALTANELDFIFHNLWTHLGQEYVKGTVADLMPETEKAQESLVKLLCTNAWRAGELTQEIVGRARLYAAVAITAGSLGRAARTALASEDPRLARAQETGTMPRGIPVKEPEETQRFWRQVQALLDHREGGRQFWARLNRTLAQGYDMTFMEKTQ
jgi:rhamnosyltransferase